MPSLEKILEDGLYTNNLKVIRVEVRADVASPLDARSLNLILVR